MKRRLPNSILLTITAIALLMCDVAIAQQSADVLRLQRAVVIDPSGFGQATPAATLFVPHGWRSTGGVEWNLQHTCTNGFAMNWSAVSADATSGVVLWPQQGWEHNGYGTTSRPGCTVAGHADALSFLNAVVASSLPSARVLHRASRPDLKRSQSHAERVVDNGYQRTEIRASGGELVIDFEMHGRALRGALSTAAVVNTITTGGSAYGAGLRNRVGFSNPIFFTYAPRAEFSVSVHRALERSLRLQRRWKQAVDGHGAALTRDNLRAIAQAGANWRATQRQIDRLLAEAWKNEQETADWRAREFTEYLRGVETYADGEAPFGQSAHDSDFDFAWRLEDGTYALTTNPGFDPFATFGVAGQQLAPLR